MFIRIICTKKRKRNIAVCLFTHLLEYTRTEWLWSRNKEETATILKNIGSEGEIVMTESFYTESSMLSSSSFIMVSSNCSQKDNYDLSKILINLLIIFFCLLRMNMRQSDTEDNLKMFVFRKKMYYLKKDKDSR